MKTPQLAGALLTTWAIAGAVFADGGFIFVEGETVDLAQTRQEVLMAFYNDATDATPHVTYVLQSRYAGTPAELAWVIPVPATPTDVVAHADGDLFDGLNEATRPRFILIRPTDHGLFPSCACAGGLDGAGDGRGTGLVEVEAQGEAGIFEWAALTSTGAEALLTWLDDNGFALPATAGSVLDGYIQQEMHFLALRVDEPSDVTSGDGEIEIPPIQFTCQTARRFYPMAISRISAAAETEVLIYVLAEHRAEGANVANAVIDPGDVAYDPNSLSSTNYEALFTQTLSDLGDTGLITEFVDWPWYAITETTWPDAPSAALALDFLTRLRTVITPEQMDQDFEFQDAPTDETVSNYFAVDLRGSVYAAAIVGQPLGALLLLGVFRVGVSRRARRGLRGKRQ